jgi:hypothetical protein
MDTLNEAHVYLLENWDTYLEMVATEEEINKYLIGLSNKIENEIGNHPEFPKDWLVISETDEDSVEIQALPKVWEKWNRYGHWLGYVAFSSLCVDKLLSKKREDNAFFGLFLGGTATSKDLFSREQAKKLWEISGEKKYVDKLPGFQWEEPYDKETCLLKHIDQVPISMIQNESELINYVVSGMIPVILAVDQIKKDHFPKAPESK